MRLTVALLGLLLLVLWPATTILVTARLLANDLLGQPWWYRLAAPAVFLFVCIVLTVVWLLLQTLLSTRLRDLLWKPHVLLPYLFWGLGVGAAFLVNLEVGSLALGGFFTGASPLIGAIIVALVFEGSVGSRDQAQSSLVAQRRGVGVMFILSGAICATFGLVSSHKYHSGYVYICFFLATSGSLTAACAVMFDIVLANTRVTDRDQFPLLSLYLLRIHGHTTAPAAGESAGSDEKLGDGKSAAGIVPRGHPDAGYPGSSVPPKAS